MDISIEDPKVKTLIETLSLLKGESLDILSIPKDALVAFEPSQVGTIVGTLMDACIPHLDKLLADGTKFAKLGISRAAGDNKDREGYPDYIHTSGLRLELKLLYVEPNDGLLKVTETPREPSARISQKVTVRNVLPEKDLLWVISYQLAPNSSGDRYSPKIIDFALFPMIECIRARDHRLIKSGGRWFGDYETPAILSQSGKSKESSGLKLNIFTYGRKESEGHDFNEDTNFGKLKRIPYKPLQTFLKLSGSSFSTIGDYPEPWSLKE